MELDTEETPTKTPATPSGEFSIMHGVDFHVRTRTATTANTETNTNNNKYNDNNTNDEKLIVIKIITSIINCVVHYWATYYDSYKKCNICYYQVQQKRRMCRLLLHQVAIIWLILTEMYSRNLVVNDFLKFVSQFVGCLE